jgi:hypothetical protein
MEILIMGIALAFNILIVLWKFQRNRVSDAIVDAGLLVLIAIVFSGSTASLMIGTVASAIISVYLLFSPIRMSHAAKH